MPRGGGSSCGQVPGGAAARCRGGELMLSGAERGSLRRYKYVCMTRTAPSPSPPPPSACATRRVRSS
eukprot:16191-Chlamydomonas_euryale.AAC.1